MNGRLQGWAKKGMSDYKSASVLPAGETFESRWLTKALSLAAQAFEWPGQ
jgi:hypothetical protein